MQQIGNGQTRLINVKGCYFWVYEATGQHVLVILEEICFMPIFSTEQKAKEGLATLRVQGNTRLKQITDTREFLESVVGKEVRVMLDPYPKGWNTRFKEVRLA